MGFRFRKSMKIMPGVQLNFGKRGVSATVGRPGASVTVGKRGTYANVGLPGTGLSYRERLELPDRRTARARRSWTHPLRVLLALAGAMWVIAALAS